MPDDMSCCLYIFNLFLRPNLYGIFIENYVVFMLYREVSRQNISKFTTNICFHSLTKRWVAPYFKNERHAISTELNIQFDKGKVT